MREGWDYVSMADYSADMTEQSDRAAGIIAKQRREIDRLRRGIAAMVDAAGGAITLQMHHLDRADWDRIEFEYREYDFSQTVRLRPPTSAS